MLGRFIAATKSSSVAIASPSSCSSDVRQTRVTAPASAGVSGAVVKPCGSRPRDRSARRMPAQYGEVPADSDRGRG
jgi:hypothetical protein